MIYIDQAWTKSISKRDWILPKNHYLTTVSLMNSICTTHFKSQMRERKD